MRCSYCGRQGHNKRTCEELRRDRGLPLTKEKGTVSMSRCGFCKERGHNVKSCQKRKDAIAWFREETGRGQRGAVDWLNSIGFGPGTFFYGQKKDENDVREAPKGLVLNFSPLGTVLQPYVAPGPQAISSYSWSVSAGASPDILKATDDNTAGLPVAVKLINGAVLFDYSIFEKVPFPAWEQSIKTNELRLLRNLYRWLVNNDTQGFGYGPVALKEEERKELFAALLPHADQNGRIFFGSVSTINYWASPAFFVPSGSRFSYRSDKTTLNTQTAHFFDRPWGNQLQGFRSARNSIYRAWSNAWDLNHGKEPQF